MEMENIQNLLEKVDLLITKNDELLDATGARFNMFKVCHVDHYENMHSAIIAEFLNPDGSHGMKSVFLEAFLAILPRNDNLPNDDFKIGAENRKVSVKTEFSYKLNNDNGRMDILITDGKYAICIENKIYADDQDKQLKRYADYLKKEYKENHWKIYYLTLGGHSASENSADGVTYIPISHSTEIVKWLDECIKIAAEKPMLRETLCQYRNHIKNLTGTNMEKKYMKELIELISENSKNYSSATQIANAIVQVEEAIIHENLPPFIEELKSFIQSTLESPDNKIKIVFDNSVSKKQWSAFRFYDKSWFFSIRFEFTKENYRDLAVRLANKKDCGDASITLPKDCPDKYTKNILIADKIGGKLKFEKDELLKKCEGILSEMLSILKKS